MEYGAEVFDRNGKRLGKIDYIIRDTWSGEIKKFKVRKSDRDLFFSPEDVIERTGSRLKLNLSLDELLGENE